MLHRTHFRSYVLTCCFWTGIIVFGEVPSVAAEPLELKIVGVNREVGYIPKAKFTQDGSLLLISLIDAHQGDDKRSRVIAFHTTMFPEIREGYSVTFPHPAGVRTISANNEVYIVDFNWSRSEGYRQYRWTPGSPEVTLQTVIGYGDAYTTDGAFGFSYLPYEDPETKLPTSGVLRTTMATGHQERFLNIGSDATVVRDGGLITIKSPKDAYGSVFQRFRADNLTKPEWVSQLPINTGIGVDASADGDMLEAEDSPIVLNDSGIYTTLGDDYHYHVFLSGRDGTEVFRAWSVRPRIQRDRTIIDRPGGGKEHVFKQTGFVGHRYFEAGVSRVFPAAYVLTIFDPEARRVYDVDTTELGVRREDQAYLLAGSPDGETLAIVKLNAPNKGESLLILAKIAPKSRPLSPRLPERLPNPQTQLPDAPSP